MSRLQGLANLVQVAVYVGLLAWVAPRWAPAAVVVGLMAAAQLAAGLMLLAGRPRRVRLLAGLTLALGALLVGFFVQAALHTTLRYGPDATAYGQGALAAIFGGIPWALGFPLWQWLAGRRVGPESVRGAGVLAACVVLGGTPALARALVDGPARAWPAQPQAAAVADAAFAAWTTPGGGDVSLPSGEGPARVLLTPWSQGQPGETVGGQGEDLGAAVAQAVQQLPAPGERPALVLDVARQAWGPDGLVPAGDGGGLAADGGGTSPTSLAWRESVAWKQPLPYTAVPVPKVPDQDRARFDSVLVDAQGARSLQLGWSAAPALDADQALAAAIAGGDYILQHQAEDGRFAYIITGPQGVPGAGYNYPRHAGVCWYLARLAQRTGLPRFQEAAQRGLDFLARDTVTLDDGRAYVRDPRRKDGRAWAGTTALAVMASASLPGGSALTGPWAAFLASSVDDRGAVRGEVDEATGAFPEQPLNPYGQSQVLLALAIALRAGDESLRPAVLRGGAFLDGAYAPGAAARLVVLDEHWACLAASAMQDVAGQPHGLGPCLGYLAESAARTPRPGSALAIAAGPGGGLAEAVVAGAFLDPDGPHAGRALAFGQHFLDNQYRAADAALLPDPQALLGAFRDRPWELDVQMDAVQHIGCALLGVEALLRGDRPPGALP